jgi:hypothetical protein
MDILNKEPKVLKNSFSIISDDKMLGQIIAILLILFTVLIAHKLPSSVTSIVRNNYFRLFFVIIVILLAKKHLAISLICLIIFFIINTAPVNNKIKNGSKNQPQTVNPPVTPSTQMTQQQMAQVTQPQMTQVTQPQMTQQQMAQVTQPQMTQQQMTQVTQPQMAQVTQPQMTQQQMTQVTQPQMTQQQMTQVTQPQMTPQQMIPTPTPIIPKIPIALAIQHALSDSMRSDTINGSAIPLHKDITQTTVSTINVVNPIADDIVNKMKENSAEYVNNTLLNEQQMRTNAQLPNIDASVSKELENSANKLALARNAITSIVNNNNVSLNESLLTNLVKSDLLNNASNKASESGDNITANQLQQISQSHLNVINGIIQSDAIKLKADEAKKNGLNEAFTTISHIADTHLLASLNMKSYNDHMEAALNAFTNGNYELSKKHEKEANTYLQKNLTLNNSIKGVPVESSKNLYEEVHFNSINNNRCDNIPAVNISGWDDYGHAAF